jgi:hypothetical protein
MAVPLELRNWNKVNSHSRILLYPLGTDHEQKTQPLCCCVAQTTQKARVTCQTASLLVRYQHWTWRGRHRKHSLIYCCVPDSVYRAVAWQHVDQIRYNIVIINPHHGTENYKINQHKISLYQNLKWFEHFSGTGKFPFNTRACFWVWKMLCSI